MDLLWLSHVLGLSLVELMGQLGWMEHLLGQVEVLLLKLRVGNWELDIVCMRGSGTLGFSLAVDL